MKIDTNKSRFKGRNCKMCVMVEYQNLHLYIMHKLSRQERLIWSAGSAMKQGKVYDQRQPVYFFSSLKSFLDNLLPNFR